MTKLITERRTLDSASMRCSARRLCSEVASSAPGVRRPQTLLQRAGLQRAQRALHAAAGEPVDHQRADHDHDDLERRSDQEIADGLGGRLKHGGTN